jgi:hypothetical protein
MRQIWECEQFKQLEDQVGAADDRRGLGGHSLRKFASTNAKRNGARTDQIEYRGRWSGDKARSICATSYIESKDPYTDAFVASVNCDGGPIAYEKANQMEAPDDFLFTHVVPSIRQRFSSDLRFCRAMGRALLWGAFDPDASAAYGIGDKIKEAYNDAFANPNGNNPIKKTPLEVLNWNGCLKIVKMDDAPPAAAAAGVAEATTVQTPGVAGDNRRFQAVLTNMERSILEKFELQQAQIVELRTSIQQQLEQINANIRRYGGTITSAFANQIRRQEEGAGNNQQQLRLDLFGQYGRIDRNATLNPRPRDLFELWQEWTEGIGDRKPAKHFTTAERNRKALGLKQKFYRRLLVWKTQARLIDGGMSVAEANHRIHTITGATTVTGVINKLIEFKRIYQPTGIHPELRNG